MAVCHECDSKVAENDIFCPYCGISLQSTDSEPVPDAPADDFESTIMMTPGEAAELAASAVVTDVVPKLEDIPEPTEVQQMEPDLVVPEVIEQTEEPSETYVQVVEDFPLLPSEPEIIEDVPVEFTDIPAPAILSESIDTSGNIPYRATAEYEKDETGEIVEQSSTPSEPDVEESVEIVQPISTPSEIDSGEEDISDEPATVLYTDIVEDIAEKSEDVSEAFVEEPVSPVVDETPFESESVDIIDEPKEADIPPISIEPAEDKMISIPGDSTPLDDPYPSQSMFDSVRIIEGLPPLPQEDVSTRVPGFTSASLPSTDFDAPIAEQTPVEERPQTTPIVSVNDADGRKSSKLKPLTEGTILNNRYEVIRKIGGGGMGAVYLASDNNLGGVLRAVKEMVQAHIEEDQQEKAINDFKRESMILSTLDHPSIPTIFDYFYDEEESRFYLVMKYISGGDLSSRLRAAPEGKIDEKTVTEWGLQVTEVLEYLHNQPTTIVYRDLKPSNIMIDGNTGRVMLIDFGIARSIGQKEEKGVTAVGTMGYAPPELFSGNVEPRSDIYSLGSTMFHLMTGADPQSNPLLIFDFQKNPRPRQINPRLSDQMERLLMRAVEYSADARFRDAAELRAALNAHTDDLRNSSVTYGAGQAPVSVSLSNQQVFCGFCGQRIVATDLFCAFCGAKQPIAQQGVHSEIYGSSTAANTARLLIEGTSDLSAPAFTLQKDENLVGRRDPMSNIFPEVDLSKYDPQTKISRRHARIWRDGQAFLLEDLGSSNGTILTSAIKDSYRLTPHKPQALTNGDKIKIGDTVLHFIVN